MSDAMRDLFGRGAAPKGSENLHREMAQFMACARKSVGFIGYGHAQEDCRIQISPKVWVLFSMGEGLRTL